jgi:hypothetical protein
MVVVDELKDGTTSTTVWRVKCSVCSVERNSRKTSLALSSLEIESKIEDLTPGPWLSKPSVCEPREK